MDDYEKKYNMFGLTPEMITKFQKYSVGIENNIVPPSSLVIKEVVIECDKDKKTAMENKNAKLV